MFHNRDYHKDRCVCPKTPPTHRFGRAADRASLGLIHISHGIPWPAEGMEKVQKAGGLVGFAASGPLSLLITPWLTGVLLFLLMVFGLLVVTATPISRIPDRLRQLWDSNVVVSENSPSVGLDILDQAERSPAPKRRTTKPKPKPAPEPEPKTTHAGDHERPYDTPVVDAAPPPAAVEPEPEPAPRAGPHPHRGAVVHPHSRGRRRLRAAASTLLKPGTPPKQRTKANEEVVQALTGVLDQFSVEHPGHRVHPRAHSQPATRSNSALPSKWRRSPH